MASREAIPLWMERSIRAELENDGRCLTLGEFVTIQARMMSQLGLSTQTSSFLGTL